ncbi:MAG: hypothetical protein EA420_15955 [Candidatus Competibacteraceae bacterium]|nr:MAG: hypothetical protein EA420_15955 [Candidatus Competibacteraceae bacterium]
MSTPLARSAHNLVGMFFEGDVLIRARDVNGVWGKRIGPVSPIKLAINPGSATTIERKLRLRTQWGQVADSVANESAAPTVAFETDDAGSELLLLAMRATETPISVAQGQRNQQVTAVPHKGSWLQLPDRNIASAGFSGRKANATALTAGTDYVLQDIWLEHGLIWIPEASTINVDEACDWTYNYGAVAGRKITGNVLAQVNLNIELFGVNRTDSSKVRLFIHEAVVAEGADLDFAATEFFKPNFGGTLITPTGQAGPYFIEPLTLTPYSA